MSKLFFKIVVSLSVCSIFIIAGCSVSANQDQPTANTARSAIEAKDATISNIVNNYSFATAAGPLDPKVLGTMTIAGKLRSQSESQFYSISCKAGVPITFYLDGYDVYLSAYIYDQSRTPIGNKISYRSSYTYTPTYTGTIYLAISGYAIPYSITVSANYNPNPKTGANQVLVSGDEYDGNTSHASDGSAVVSITATGPASFFIDSPCPYMTATIVDSQNRQIGAINQGHALVFDNLTAGLYKLQVSGYAGQNYKFYVNPQSGPSLVYDAYNGGGSHTFYCYFDSQNTVNNVYQSYRCSVVNFNGDTTATGIWAGYVGGYNHTGWDYYQDNVSSPVCSISQYPTGFYRLSK